jgi:hypothetical protein
MDDTLILIDASTYQKQLGSLGETVSYKVEREGAKHIKPVFAAADIHAMLRQAWNIYGLFFFVNADEHRKGGVWKPGYTAALLPLIRTMIDILYNVTTILANPGKNAYLFREAGYRRVLADWDEAQAKYGGDPKWGEYIERNRRGVEDGMRADGITKLEVESAEKWLTMSEYLRVNKGQPPTPHQEFLKRLTFGYWKEYASASHAAFQGLLPNAIFFMPHAVPHEARDKFEVAVDDMVAIHLTRLAGLFISVIAEIQAYFRFDGARINERIREVWDALLLMPDVRELYDGRYAELMNEKGISRL